ncbi:hypothetical protein HOE31_03405 [bacterium]|jgi:hypothetical protein|nr:hypothetical protein [bacterium]MBT4121965.1 hypothetical protein [bacterium]MBT4335486.1 hypothetical protein [bacterium]MBT4495481.1 hypothetical protein [bacterium]MBT4764328.1 hypothetical protein [bacterium]
MDYEINDISDRRLKVGYWLITHIKRFKQAITIFLALVCFVTVSFSIYGWVIHFKEQKDLNRAISGIGTINLDFEAYHDSIKPNTLVVSESTVIYTGEGKYDILTKIANPNNRWQVDKLVYQFESSFFTSPSSTVYLLPNQEKYLVSYANTSHSRIGVPEFKILDLEMTLIKPYQNLPEINFNISDIEFTAEGEEDRSKVTFNVLNNTLYNFWEVDFLVIIYSGDTISGVNQIKLGEFLGNSTRVGEVSWFERLPRITKVDVYPYVDLLDQSITYTIPGEAGDLY